MKATTTDAEEQELGEVIDADFIVLPCEEETFDTREKWEEAIRKTIGASPVATIMGAQSRDTPLALYGRLRGDLPPIEVTNRMQSGTAAEPLIAHLYHKETGRSIFNPGDYTIQINPDIPWMHCTVDRLATREDRPDGGVVELKKPGWRMRKDWIDGTPIYVQMQIQAQLAVTGLQWGSAAALIDDDEFVWEDHERNDKFIAAMLKKTKEFWERVQNGDPPETTEGDVETIKLLYSDCTEGKVIELPDAANLHGEMRDTAKKDWTRAEKAHEYHSMKIREMIGDAEKGTLLGGGGFTLKQVNKKAHTVKATSYRELRRTDK